MRGSIVVSAVVLCLAGIAAGIALRLSEGSTLWVVSKDVPTWARGLPLPSDKRIRALRQQLLRATSDLGDHPAEGLLVITRRKRFYRAIGSSGSPRAPNDVIFVISAHGDFTCGGCSRPGPGPPQRGEFMLAFGSLRGKGESGFELGSGPSTDLSKLGRTILLDLDS